MPLISYTKQPGNDQAIERTLYRRLILLALRDIAGTNGRHRTEAIEYVRGQDFIEHQKKAGFPAELRDTVLDLVVASETRRVVMAAEIISLLGHYQR